MLLNLAVERETAGLTIPNHLAALLEYDEKFRADVVLADPTVVNADGQLRIAAERLGARLDVAPVGVASGAPQHDADALARELAQLFGLG